MNNDRTIELLSNLIKIRTEGLSVGNNKIKELQNEISEMEKNIKLLQSDIDDYKLAISKLKEGIIDEPKNSGASKPSRK